MYLNFVGGNLSPTFKGAIAMQLMDVPAPVLRVFRVESVKVEMGDWKLCRGPLGAAAPGADQSAQIARVD